MKAMICLSIVSMLTLLATQAMSNEKPKALLFKDEFIRRLADAVPGVLQTQDPKTGRFGTGIWIVQDQNAMFSLAAAWSIQSPDNPYYHSDEVLQAVVSAGDALIADMNPNGSWEFRKKDGSTWGPIYMPWTYSAWIKSYALIKEGMSADQRAKWDEALTRGFTGISTTCLDHIHNIPTNQACALYIAGQILNRPEWCKHATEFMAKVVAKQDPAGFWSENYGPVVRYGSVYTDAFCVYYSVSHDDTVLPAIKKATDFYSSVIYPNGEIVETVDERNGYHTGVAFPNAMYTLTPEGRGYMRRQWNLLTAAGHNIGPDNMANYLIYGQEGPTAESVTQSGDTTYVFTDGKGLIRRKGPWFVCLSAYCCPIPTSRWIQDRQNFMSIYHDKLGVIIGGGNTKLQPLWSNFTVGDTSLLAHADGDQAPDFLPKGPLFHVPSSASLKKTDPVGLNLQYGEERCHIFVEPLDEKTMLIHLQASADSGMPVEGHITLMPEVEGIVRTASGREVVLGKEPFDLTSDEIGGWIAHRGWKLTIPQGARLVWPVLPHNPYRKDGSATPEEARLVVCVPFSTGNHKAEMTLSIE